MSHSLFIQIEKQMNFQKKKKSRKGASYETVVFIPDTPGSELKKGSLRIRESE